jgi:hypothetical protein
MVETEAALPGTVHEAAALDDHVPPLVVWRSKTVIFLAAMEAVLRIRDVYPGSDFFPARIPDPNCLHPGSRILIKEFKYFNQGFGSGSGYGSGSPWIRINLSCWIRIRIQIADPDPDPGGRK